MKKIAEGWKCGSNFSESLKHPQYAVGSDPDQAIKIRSERIRYSIVRCKNRNITRLINIVLIVLMA
jgi:hypothetical protein